MSDINSPSIVVKIEKGDEKMCAFLFENRVRKERKQTIYTNGILTTKTTYEFFPYKSQ